MTQRIAKPGFHTRLAIVMVLMILWLYASTELLFADDPNNRMDFNGFSVIPPEGGDWTLLWRSRHSASFGWKTRSSSTHSVMAGATIERQPRIYENKKPFMDFVRTLFPDKDPTGRIDFMTQEIIEDNISGMHCARVYEFSRDREAANRGPAPFLLFENFALLCVHAMRADHVIGLSFSQRYSPDETVADIAVEANRFFKSLIATGLPTRAESHSPAGARSRN